MAINIKELAANYFKNRLNLTVKDVEHLLQDVYEEGIKSTPSNFSLLWKNSENQNVAEWDGREWTTIGLEKIPVAFSPQPHYDNSKGSLYKIAKERGWNPYVFDAVKRLERAEKKGQFKEDLQKTKDLIDIYLSEYEKD